MGTKRYSITLSEEVAEKAKQRTDNFSRYIEHALIEKMTREDVSKPNSNPNIDSNQNKSSENSKNEESGL